MRFYPNTEFTRKLPISAFRRYENLCSSQGSPCLITGYFSATELVAALGIFLKGVSLPILPSAFLQTHVWNIMPHICVKIVQMPR